MPRPPHVRARQLKTRGATLVELTLLVILVVFSTTFAWRRFGKQLGVLICQATAGLSEAPSDHCGTRAAVKALDAAPGASTLGGNYGHVGLGLLTKRLMTHHGDAPPAPPPGPSIADQARHGELYSPERSYSLDQLARQPTLSRADWKLLVDVVSAERGAKIDLAVELRRLATAPPPVDLADPEVAAARRALSAQRQRAEAAGVKLDYEPLDASSRVALMTYLDEQPWFAGPKARLGRALRDQQPEVIEAIDKVLAEDNSTRRVSLLGLLRGVPLGTLPDSTVQQLLVLAASKDLAAREAVLQAIDLPALKAAALKGDGPATRALVRLVRWAPNLDTAAPFLDALGSGVEGQRLLADLPAVEDRIADYNALVKDGHARGGEFGKHVASLYQAAASVDRADYNYLSYLEVLHPSAVVADLRRHDLAAYREALPRLRATAEARQAAFAAFIRSAAFQPYGKDSTADVEPARQLVLAQARAKMDAWLAKLEAFDFDAPAYQARLDAIKPGETPKEDPLLAQHDAGTLDFAAVIAARLAAVERRINEPQYADRKLAYQIERDALTLWQDQAELTLLERESATERNAYVAGLSTKEREELYRKQRRVQEARTTEALSFTRTGVAAAGVISKEASAAQARSEAAHDALGARLKYIRWLRTDDGKAKAAEYLKDLESPPPADKVPALSWTGAGLKEKPTLGQYGDADQQFIGLDLKTLWAMSSEKDFKKAKDAADAVYKSELQQLKDSEGFFYRSGDQFTTSQHVKYIARSRAITSYIDQIEADPRHSKSWATEPVEHRELWTKSDKDLDDLATGLSQQLAAEAEAKDVEVKAAEVHVHSQLKPEVLLELARDEVDQLIHPPAKEAKGLIAARPSPDDSASLKDLLDDLDHDLALAKASPGYRNLAGERAAVLLRTLADTRPLLQRLSELESQFPGDAADDQALRKALEEMARKLRAVIAASYSGRPKTLQAEILDARQSLKVLYRAELAVLLRRDGDLERDLAKIEINAEQARQQLVDIYDKIKGGSHGTLAWPLPWAVPDTDTEREHVKKYQTRQRTDVKPLRAEVELLQQTYDSGKTVDLKQALALRDRVGVLAARQAMVDLHNQLLYFETAIDEYPTAKGLRQIDDSFIAAERQEIAKIIDKLDAASGDPAKQHQALVAYQLRVGDGSKLDAAMQKAGEDLGAVQFTVGTARSVYVAVLAAAVSGGAAGVVGGAIEGTGASLSLGGLVTFDTTAVAAGGSFVTEVAAFTLASRGINNLGGIANEKGLAEDLAFNFVTFGTLHGLGRAFEGLKGLESVKGWLGEAPTLGQRALVAVAHQGVDASALVIISQADFYLHQGRLQNGDELGQNLTALGIQLAAFHVMGLARSEPTHTDVLQRIAAADPEYRAAINSAGKLRDELNQLAKKETRNFGKERELGLKIAAIEEKVYAQVVEGGKITLKNDPVALGHAKDVLANYARAALRVEAHLALLGLSAPDSPNFWTDESGVVVYRDGGLSAIKEVVDHLKGSITDHGNGKLTVSLPDGTEIQLAHAQDVLDGAHTATDGKAQFVDAETAANARLVGRLPGVLDLVIHSTPSGNLRVLYHGTWVELTPRDLADWVIENANRLGYRKGMPIRLLTPDAGGDKIASELEARLKGTVIAADARVTIESSGELAVEKGAHWSEYSLDQNGKVVRREAAPRVERTPLPDPDLSTPAKIRAFVGPRVRKINESPELARFRDQQLKYVAAYFEAGADPETGFVRDRLPNFGPIPEHGWASSAATGFYLAWLATDAEAHPEQKPELEAKALKVLHATETKVPNFNGWLPHFFDSKSGAPWGNCEYSTVDTALFMIGALQAREVFGHDSDAGKTADRLYRRLRFNAMRTDGDTASMKDNMTLSMGWKPGPPSWDMGTLTTSPEGGYLKSRWDRVSELKLLLILGLGHPEDPLPPQAWDAWNRTLDADKLPLFTYQYTAGFIDLTDLGGGKYLKEAILAAIHDRNFCAADCRSPGNQRLGYWGISATDGPPSEPGGPHSYRAMWPASYDGTVSLDGALATSMWLGALPLEDAHEWLRDDPSLNGRFGFSDGHRVDPKDGTTWIGVDVIGITKGANMLSLLHDQLAAISGRIKYVSDGLETAERQEQKAAAKP